MERSKSRIYEILSKFDNAITKQHSCRPRRTSLRQDRAVFTQKKPVLEAAMALAFPMTRSTVNRHIQTSKIHKYQRKCRTNMPKVHTFFYNTSEKHITRMIELLSVSQ